LTVVLSVQDVVDSMDAFTHEHRAFLNKSTGEIFMLSTEELSAAEDGVDVSGYLVWQQEMMAEAGKVLAGDGYILLPDATEVNAYGIMQDFCSAVEDR
jgi:hypothetical protein